MEENNLKEYIAALPWRHTPPFITAENVRGTREWGQEEIRMWWESEREMAPSISETAQHQVTGGERICNVQKGRCQASKNHHSLWQKASSLREQPKRHSMFQRVKVRLGSKVPGVWARTPTEGLPADPQHFAMFPGKKIPWPEEYLSFYLFSNN